MKYLSYAALQDKPCFILSPLHGLVGGHLLNREMNERNEWRNECDVTEKGTNTKVEKRRNKKRDEGGR